MKPPVFSDDLMMAADMPDDEFAAWFVADIMKDDLPDYYTDLGPQTCATFTINARRYARHFGITRPDLQAQFVYLMWTVGPNFWSFGAFNRILTAKWPREADKIDALFNVSSEDAEEAILGADDRYWIPRMIPENILGDRYEDVDHG